MYFLTKRKYGNVTYRNFFSVESLNGEFSSSILHLLHLIYPILICSAFYFFFYSDCWFYSQFFCFKHGIVDCIFKNVNFTKNFLMLDLFFV